MKNKTIIYRSILSFAYICLFVFVFLTGRTHTLLIDNKTTSDGVFQAVNGMKISVNKGSPVEYLKGDRDLVLVKGQKVHMNIEFFDGRESINSVFSIPLSNDMVILSIPKLIGGDPLPLEVFDSYKENKAKTDSEEGERFGQ